MASFAAVGIVNSAVDASVFFLAYLFITSSLVAANASAWLVAVTCSYVLNSHITFAAESGRQLRLRSYGVFVASGVVGLIGNTTALLIAAQYLPVWGAKAIAIVVAFTINFSLSHFVVFRTRKPAQDAR
jgi:putative flippase GtrA